MGYFGPAASAAVSGQVQSALGVFGVPDSPGWLQGISQFVSGISVSGPGGTAHGGRAGQQPGPVYNIRTATVEDAFTAALRKERERAAAKLSRF